MGIKESHDFTEAQVKEEKITSHIIIQLNKIQKKKIKAFVLNL